MSLTDCADGSGLIILKGMASRLMRALRQRAKTIEATLVREKTKATQHTIELQDLDSLLNREMGERFLVFELARLAEELPLFEKNLSIVMLDIDELTLINKQYGKNVGDKVLTCVANLVKLDGSKTSSRCGDDTFYAVLHGEDDARAEAIAENMRRKIQRFRWSRIAAGLHVTCSLGVAQLHHGEPTIDCVVRSAIGMITAKNSGRNRVEFGPEHLSKEQSRNLSQYFS